ncbi:hypothetical protein RRG08_038292 [Elysia crispata]|uniref:Uncharacterized protein n=1 Tax=Elysia crispata TaxID=231223 RepID=A0AAE1E1F9_9GAST|nr:hypothetical protein RRG08_038292 [Elysia crispata]
MWSSKLGRAMSFFQPKLLVAYMFSSPLPSSDLLRALHPLLHFLRPVSSSSMFSSSTDASEWVPYRLVVDGDPGEVQYVYSTARTDTICRRSLRSRPHSDNKEGKAFSTMCLPFPPGPALALPTSTHYCSQVPGPVYGSVSSWQSVRLAVWGMTDHQKLAYIEINHRLSCVINLNFSERKFGVLLALDRCPPRLRFDNCGHSMSQTA